MRSATASAGAATETDGSVSANDSLVTRTAACLSPNRKVEEPVEAEEPMSEADEPFGFVVAERPSAATNQQEITCGICLEDVSTTQLARTPCMHAFCEPCLTTWKMKGSTCPECRTDLTPAVAPAPVDEADDAVMAAAMQAVLATPRQKAAGTVDDSPMAGAANKMFTGSSGFPRFERQRV